MSTSFAVIGLVIVIINSAYEIITVLRTSRKKQNHAIRLKQRSFSPSPCQYKVGGRQCLSSHQDQSIQCTS